ncbi:DNA repair RecN domain protein [Brucella melitensis bv. 2 str. 63/9]|nr:DNA repair RecN domain protein [Brucella melitensis bv. 2 str. 63/9]
MGFKLDQLFRPCIEIGQIGIHLVTQRRQTFHRDGIFARRRTQGEQAFFHLLQHTRIKIDLAHGVVDTVLRPRQTVQRLVYRLANRLQQMGRFNGLALQTAHQACKRRHGRSLAGKKLACLIDIASDLFRFHHRRAAFCKFLLLARLRIKLGQLLHRGTQIIALTLGLLHAGAVLCKRAFRITPRLVAFAHQHRLCVKPAESVEKCAVQIGVDQRAVIMLAMNFYEPLAQIAQERNACRLIIDEDTRAPVPHLEAAQDDVTIIVKPVFAQKKPGWMIARHIENRRYLSLIGTMAHKRGITTRTKRQRQRIEQNGLTRTGFTRKHGQAAPELDVEPFNQNNIADRQVRQHVGISL